MIKSLNKSTTKEIQKRIAVIKNAHTDDELAESGERWANHVGPRMTLAEVLAAEAVKQK